LQRAEDQVEWTTPQEPRKGVRKGARRMGIMGAVHVDVSEWLESPRPAGGWQSDLGVPRVAQPARLQQRAGQRRVGALVAPGKARLRPHRPARAGIAERLVVAALEPIVAAGAP